MKERWVAVFHTIACTGDHISDPEPMCAWFARKVIERMAEKELSVVDALDLHRGNGILTLYSEDRITAL
jgi:hypothetical protein